jgi:Uma2 family endonuclease
MRAKSKIGDMMSTALEEPQEELEKLEAFIVEERYEIIDGEFVELSPKSADSQGFAFRLARHLSNFGIDRDVGEAFTEILVKLPLPVDRNRRPDAIFVPYDRWPKNKPLPDTNAWDVLPSVCVEVVSPRDLAEEILDKLLEYFESGVQQVWVAYPRHGLLFVHDSPTAVRVLTRDEILEGGTVLPGFRLALSELFPKPKSESDPGQT